MTKSELIEPIAEHQNLVSVKETGFAVKLVSEYMAQCLFTCNRIEIDGLAASPSFFMPPNLENRYSGG